MNEELLKSIATKMQIAEPTRLQLLRIHCALNLHMIAEIIITEYQRDVSEYASQEHSHRSIYTCGAMAGIYFANIRWLMELEGEKRGRPLVDETDAVKAWQKMYDALVTHNVRPPIMQNVKLKPAPMPFETIHATVVKARENVWDLRRGIHKPGKN